MVFNRRFVFFLVLDAVILLSLMGIFAALNHAYVPASSKESGSSLAQKVQITPAMAAIPQTIAARKPSGEIQVVQEGDQIDLKKILSRSVTVAVHSIEMGENYWTIAAKNHINVDSLIGANPGMPFSAKVKQALDIPSRNGVLVTVEKNETLSQIASDYGVDEEILNKENPIHWWRGLRPGDVLFIPGVRPQRMTKEWKDYFDRRGIFGDPLGRWQKINSPFGKRIDPITGDVRHHNGVDLHAKYGDSVFAAAGGKVIFTGVSGGYGNLIILAHANHYQTYYGHLSKILVKTGQRVRRGSLIGKVGATGRVTGPHLHFEVHHNGKAQDPLFYI